MNKVTIAFDIDGTLRCNCTETCQGLNKNIVELAGILKGFKNVKLIVWSGGGLEYARQFVRSRPHLQSIFKENIYTKLDAPEVHIAIDDQQEFNLGNINLIVREK